MHRVMQSVKVFQPLHPRTLMRLTRATGVLGLCPLASYSQHRGPHHTVTVDTLVTYSVGGVTSVL